MSSRMRNLDRDGDIIKRCYNNARKNHDMDEQYRQTDNLKKNIKEKEELNNMDPNSKEYDKAQMEIDKQKGDLIEMEHNNKRDYSADEKRDKIEELQHNNDELSKKMDNAVKKGDTRSFDEHRATYQKNIEKQERYGNELKQEGESYKDTVHQQKVAQKDLDIDMRDKFGEKIQNGKANEKDKEAFQKYSEQTKKSEIDLVKYQNQKSIESMRERGCSEEQIKIKEEENKRSEQWVERINR